MTMKSYDYDDDNDSDGSFSDDCILVTATTP